MDSPERSNAPSRNLWGEFLFSRVLVFVVSRESYGDMEGYFEAVSKLFAGESPYGEEGFGYPALAFFFVALPSLFGADEFHLYYPLYRAQCFVCDVIVFVLLSRRCRRSTLLVYIVCSAVLANLLYHRLDLALGCMLVVVLFLEERKSVRLASFALGASVAFKVIPVLLVPAWLFWHVRRSLRDALNALGWGVLGGALPVAIAFAIWGRDAVFFMGAHAERGVQIESTWATISVVLMQFGVPGETYWNAGSHNLSTPLESSFTTASHFLGMAAAIMAAVLALKSPRGRAFFAPIVASTLGVSIAVSKVFSPQFLLFFLPVLAWCADGLRPRIRHAVLSLALAACALTTWVYPYHEKELVDLEAVAVVPLALRNLCYAVLAALVVIEAWRRKSVDDREEEAGPQDPTE